MQVIRRSKQVITRSMQVIMQSMQVIRRSMQVIRRSMQVIRRSMRVIRQSMQVITKMGVIRKYFFIGQYPPHRNKLFNVVGEDIINRKKTVPKGLCEKAYNNFYQKFVLSGLMVAPPRRGNIVP